MVIDQFLDLNLVHSLLNCLGGMVLDTVLPPWLWVRVRALVR